MFSSVDVLLFDAMGMLQVFLLPGTLIGSIVGYLVMFDLSGKLYSELFQWQSCRGRLHGRYICTCSWPFMKYNDEQDVN